MSAAHTKALAVRVKASAAIDDATLALIRAHTLRDFSADELVVREFILAHNAIDRDDECFAPALLDDFARTLPGKGVFIRHPGGWDGDGGPGEGKVYAATTERMTLDAARTALREPTLRFPPDATDAILLKALAYYVKTPENVAFLLKLDAGIGGDVSIGFNAKSMERLKDLSGIELNAWRWIGPGEAREMSHVWLGAQPGARATKSAQRNPEKTTMDPEQIKALQDENTTLKSAAAAQTKAAATLAALQKALGTDAGMVDTPDVLVKAVNDGRAYRKELVDSLITTERHLKLVGDTDDAVKAARDVYEGMPTDKLVNMQKHLDARNPATTKVIGGDPNTGKPGAGAPAAGSPATNPAFA